MLYRLMQGAYAFNLICIRRAAASEVKLPCSSLISFLGLRDIDAFLSPSNMLQMSLKCIQSLAVNISGARALPRNGLSPGACNF